MTPPERPTGQHPAGDARSRLGARLRALLPAGLRARLPPAARVRPGPAEDAANPARGSADAPSDRDPPAGRPDGPPFVAPNDVWNRPRRPARPASPFQALNPFRPNPSRQPGSDPRPAPPRSAPRDPPGPPGPPGPNDPRDPTPPSPGRLMPGSSSPGRPSLGAVARGLWRLACGHADGLDSFNATVVGFLGSLLPLLLLALLMAAGGNPDASRSLAVAVVGLLAPPVLSHALAARWGREREWLRYAVSVNWCQWALPMLVAVLLLVVRAATGGGAAFATPLVLLAVVAYWLWLNWFIARHALKLPGGRAALLVVLVSLGSGALVLLPQLAAIALTRG